jgi:tRNA modification GTPase
MPRLVVRNKIDLTAEPPALTHDGDTTHVALSAKTGVGMEALEQALLEIAGWQDSEDTFIARARHLQALEAGATHLAAARAELETAPPALELFAENLRLAQNALAEITGEFSADDLLGAIFSRFCIGK